MRWPGLGNISSNPTFSSWFSAYFTLIYFSSMHPKTYIFYEKCLRIFWYKLHLCKQILIFFWIFFHFYYIKKIRIFFGFSYKVKMGKKSKKNPKKKNFSKIFFKFFFQNFFFVYLFGLGTFDTKFVFRNLILWEVITCNW